MSIRKLVGDFLDTAKVEASFELMGVDTNLITNGTYFAIEQDNKIMKQLLNLIDVRLEDHIIVAGMRRQLEIQQIPARLKKLSYFQICSLE